MRPEDILELKVPSMKPAEAVYIPEIVRGFGTTLRHFFTSFAKGKTSRTMEYPEERREDMPIEQGGMNKGNFRGVHRLNRDEQGRVKCVACMMCPTICPARCIHIQAGESPWDDREKYPVKFEIDELRCIFCGMCEEACPEDAIFLEKDYELSDYNRDAFIYTKDELVVPMEKSGYLPKR